ncbi:GNAT family N-acetyltransferase [Paenibacillaceae bacterium]|nr:GNAT family N-acetyltransferase [Paenibacillaceae bacterium]
MSLFQQDELSVRALEAQDADLLARWLSDPAVLKYYEGRDRPHDRELVEQHFYKGSEGIIRGIILHGASEIGYIQMYEIDEEDREAYGYQDVAGSIYGMDQFIGEPAYWNKGIGSRLIPSVVDYLVNCKGARKIIMDPQTWNVRALRVYEKSGFVKKKLLEKHEWHEGEYRDCWLIEYDAAEENNTEASGLTEAVKGAEQR